jgi:large subunit ribosomal protein L4
MTNETPEETPQESPQAITIDRHNDAGEVVDTVALDAAIFGVTPNVPLMHQVVTAQLAARRAGTHSTLTRAEVRGGGAKPYRQKGTGRARQGSLRAPHYAGGGVALGPKPRNYAQRTPRKMVRLALCSALSDRVNGAKLRLVDSWSFEVPKTKDAVKALEALELEGRILVVLSNDDAAAERSFGNLQNVTLLEASQLTAYEVMAHDWIVFTTATVPGGVTVVKAAPKKRASKKSSDAPADAATASDDAEAVSVEDSAAEDDEAEADEEGDDDG